MPARRLPKVVGKVCRRKPDHNNQPEIFLTPGACFVTLHKQGQLRGCIGSLEAHRLLLDDVLHNAFASAFRDHRFPPVQQGELADLHIEISILTPKQMIEANDEKELFDQLRPDIDGLIIKSGFQSATFLPQVWGAAARSSVFSGSFKTKSRHACGYLASGYGMLQIPVCPV